MTACTARLGGACPRATDRPRWLSGMNHRATVLERAFELARSGRPRRTQDIVAALSREGYATEQIEGPVLKRQLLNLIKAARSVSSDPDRT
jgi:hypothetical protein